MYQSVKSQFPKLSKGPLNKETFALPTELDILQHLRVEEESTVADEMDDSEEPQKISPSEALKMLELVELSILRRMVIKEMLLINYNH